MSVDFNLKEVETMVRITPTASVAGLFTAISLVPIVFAATRRIVKMAFGARFRNPTWASVTDLLLRPPEQGSSKGKSYLTYLFLCCLLYTSPSPRDRG
eukprot:164462-Amphidinium_carterae.1